MVNLAPILTLLFPAILLLQGPSDAFDPEGKVVRGLEIAADGPLTRISADACHRLIQFQVGRPYRASDAKNSIERLYATGVFYDVQITVRAQGDGVLVHLALVRQYRLRDISYEGDLRLKRQDLRREFGLRSGLAFSPQSLEQGLERLRQLYRNRGYYQAQIETDFRRHVEAAELDIVATVQAGVPATVLSLKCEESETGKEIPSCLEGIETQPGGSYSRVSLSRDLETIRNRLLLDGYLTARVEVAELSYKPDSNAVQVLLEVNKRLRTPVRVQGADFTEEEILSLSVFAHESTRGVFVEESIRQVRTLLQEKGFFLASARADFDEEAPENGVVFHADPGRRFKGLDVAFEGIRTVSEAALRRNIRVADGGWFRAPRFSSELAERDTESLISFLRTRGFLGAEVSCTAEPTSPSSDRIRVTFRIREGDRSYISAVEIFGARKLTGEELKQRIASQPGQPFSPLQAAQDRIAIIATYEDLGYREADCRVKRIPAQAGVRLEFWVTEGERSFVDEVVVTGNLRTRGSVVRREVDLEPGDPLSQGKILAGETNLYNLAVFDRVQIREAEASDDPNRRTVIVALEESPRYTLLYGIGYSSFEGPRGTLGISDLNFRGRAEVLALSLRASGIRQRGSLSWTLPRLHQWKFPWIISTTVRNEKRRTTNQNQTTAIQGKPFDEFRAAYSVQTQRPLSRRESIVYELRHERVQIDTPPDLQTRPEFFRQEDRLALSSLSATYINESRDVPTDPTKGFFLSGDAALASRLLGSQEEYFKILAQGHYYQPLKAGVLLALSVRLGWIWPYGRTTASEGENPVPISERFFSGGSTTLRGLPQDLAGPLLRDPNTGEIVLVNDRGEIDPDGRPVPEGGNALLVSNVELRIPLNEYVTGTLFYDVGNVYRSFSDFRFSDLSHTPGFGVRVNTPVGPIRFDVGYNPSPPAAPGFHRWNFHLSLGHAF